MSYARAIISGVTEPVRTGVPTTAADLTALTEAGRRLKYLLFWGHKPERDGTVGAGSLSQWWPAPFTSEGVTFGSAEHYMMWRKARLFGDAESAERIVRAGHPRQAKMLGRGVQDFEDQVWVAERFGIVVDASVAKFGQHDDLRAFLLGTGERVLVEASPTDRIWGIGLAATDDRSADPGQWRGLNLLGFALMQARAVLRSSPGA